jgi:hypothetical protein
MLMFYRFVAIDILKYRAFAVDLALILLSEDRYGTMNGWLTRGEGRCRHNDFLSRRRFGRLWKGA